MKASESKRRWFYPQPAWLIVLSLASTGFLFLSEQGKWFAFNQHKGWTVLIAVASAAAVLAVMLLWWLAALVFRWRFQFSIRSLLVLALVVALPCSWLAVKLQQARRQRETVTEIEKWGGTVKYDWEIDGNGVVDPSAEPPGPIWLRSVLGKDFFQSVDIVLASNSRVTDAALERLSGLNQLRRLYLCYTKVTDAGLEHLKCFRQLNDLYLGGTTTITDAGLEHLKGLSQLHELDLYGTPVTDAGLEHLKDLRELKSVILCKTQITDAGVKHLKSWSQLEFLSLSSAKITDAALEHLSGLSQLERLCFFDTQVTDAGVEKLRQALPNCTIEH
jgi:hypothetical protein